MNIHEPHSLFHMTPPAPKFADEAERLRILEQFEAERLEDDPELVSIVKFAAKLCDVPVSMVTLLDDKRQYFVVRTGVDDRETPRELSFCTHALGQPDMLEIPDATQDARFSENPLVTGDHHVRYYAGQPLVSEEGAPLGTLCVVDTQPHKVGLSDIQREGLAVLAQAAMRRLRARRLRLQAAREIEHGEERFRALADAMPVIAFAADGDGKFDYFNQRMADFTGLSLPIHQDEWPKILHPEDHESINTSWSNAVAARQPYEQENRLLRADGQWRWMLIRALPVKSKTSDEVRWFGTMTDIDDAHKVSEGRDMLAKELSHRIKNIFAVISGLISLQARKQPEHKAFAQIVTETLRALGRAHDFVRPASGSTRESMTGLFGVIFAPYLDAQDVSRITLRGDECAISPNAATTMALVFHELATNSAKYGALSVDTGNVTLDVSEVDDTLRMVWAEHGGPKPIDDGKTGFGSRMVEMAVTGQLQGSWERRFEESGLVVELTLLKAAIAPRIAD